MDFLKRFFFFTRLYKNYLKTIENKKVIAAKVKVSENPIGRKYNNFYSMELNTILITCKSKQ